MGRVKETLLAYQYDPNDFDDSDYDGEGVVDDSIWDRYDYDIVEEYLQQA